MDYNYPDKKILEKRSEELGKDDRYYNLRKLIFQKDFNNKLLIPLGIDGNNEKYYIDLIDKSGLFISGETGSGKSNFLNDIIISLLLKNSPEELQLILIDSKNVEFNIYNEIPHVYNKKNITDINTSLIYLKEEMKRRRELFASNNVKRIEDYNSNSQELLPHLVLIIDETELPDNCVDHNDLIRGILSEGYKLGLHLILATSSYLKDNYDSKMLNEFNYVLSFDQASEEQAEYLKIKKANLLSVYGEALIKLDDESIANIQVPYTCSAILSILSLLTFQWSLSQPLLILYLSFVARR